MKTILATKKFRLQTDDKQYLEKLTEKLAHFMPLKNPDFPLLEIIIRKYKKTIRGNRGKRGTESAVYYEGTLELVLPKKRLIGKMLNRTVHEAIKDGFNALFREIEKYKGFHFSGYSKYYSHATIRK